MTIKKLFACALVALILCSAALPARAEDDNGGFVTRPRRQQRQEEATPAPKPPPANAPATERQGDDLIVHAPGGDVTQPGFFTGMEDGTQKPFTLQIPGQGSCTIQIGVTGAVLDMTCQ